MKFRKTAAKLDAVLDHIERSIEPVTKHATQHRGQRRLHLDVDSRGCAGDPEDAARRRTRGFATSIESSERRLHELGAVLRVVQEEAEQAFVSTASTIRGVRAGAESFRENGARLPQSERLDASRTGRSR